MAHSIGLLNLHGVAQSGKGAPVADAAADGKAQQEKFEEVGQPNPRVSELVGTTLGTAHDR
jgi:hypothetical protein